MEFDVAVIGAGPAGLQAALHAARKKVKVCVLGKVNNSALMKAEIEFGLLQPSLARQHDLRDAVLLAELNLDLLLARRNPNKSFRPLPAFPAIRRDIAMILPAATTHESILQVIKQAKPANLEAVELFDVFRGKNVPAGQKSMAYAFTYRHADRTLTDAEVNAVHDKLVVHLKQRLQATVRE